MVVVVDHETIMTQVMASSRRTVTRYLGVHHLPDLCYELVDVSAVQLRHPAAYLLYPGAKSAMAAGNRRCLRCIPRYRLMYLHVHRNGRLVPGRLSRHPSSI